MSVLRLGTRRSALAITQSRTVATAIEAAAAASGRPVQVELVEITTTGDVSPAPLASLGGVGVFVARLREALLDDQVDVAVHSLKDIPTYAFSGLMLAAVPLREDPRDVLVSSAGTKLADLPAGARIGTGSPRRAAQLRALGQGLEVVEVRGNVDTRLGMVGDRLDGVLLANAGLRRLGRSDEITEVIEAEVMLPAPGQGALAVECREADVELIALLAALDDPITRACVIAERALMATLEAGCSAPLGALATHHDGELVLRAIVLAPDGSRRLELSRTGSITDPGRLGADLATDLLDAGATELMTTASAAVPFEASASGAGR